MQRTSINQLLPANFIAMAMVCVSLGYANAAPSKWPVPSSKKISGVYGDWRDDASFRFHPSVDIEGTVGALVVAAEAGTVKKVMDIGTPILAEGTINETLRIQIGSGRVDWYAHMVVTSTIKDALVSGDVPVSAGQVIGSILLHPTIVHLDFGIHGLGDQALENPLNPLLLGGLVESADSTKPFIDSITLKGDDGGTPGFLDLAVNPPIVAGKIDVIPKAFDDNGASLKAGIWRIGYAVKDEAGNFVLGTTINPIRFLLDDFTNTLPPATQEALDTVFSRTNPISHFSIDGGRYSYIVTNKKAGTLDKTGVWATQAKVGTSADGSGADSLAVEDAIVKDGRNTVVVIAQDRKGNTNNLDASSEKVVIVD